MKKIYNNIVSSRLFQPVIIALAFAGALSSVSVFAADWQAPLAAPPTCVDGNPGCDAPLHVGTAAQVKAGALGVNGLLSAYNGISVTTGYLGIGVAAAGRPLHINMPSEDSAILIETQNTSAYDVLTTYRIAGAGGIRWNTGIDHSDANKFKVASGNTFNNFGTGDRLVIDPATGYVGINTASPTSALQVNGEVKATTLTQTSARRFKENIVDSSYGLSDVLKLQPVKYVLKDDARHAPQIGFIADDVAKIMPEIVSHDPDGQVAGMDYSRLSVSLVGAVKELNAKQDILQKEIDSLKQADGLILKAKGGTNCFELSVNDNGSITTTKVACVR